MQATKLFNNPDNCNLCGQTTAINLANKLSLGSAVQIIMRLHQLQMALLVLDHNHPYFGISKIFSARDIFQMITNIFGKGTPELRIKPGASLSKC